MLDRCRKIVINERERHRLYERLGETIGVEEADILMELLPPTSWDQISTTQQVDNLGTDLRSEMSTLSSALRTEMADLRTDLQSEMANLRSELRTDMSTLSSELRTEMAGLRGDIELGMARNLRVQVASNFAAMLTLAVFIIGLG